MIIVETMTVTETTTDGDWMTAVIDIAMTETTIMIGMKTSGMTDLIRGIHVMIDETLTEDRATIEGITTTVVCILLKMTRATQTRPRTTHKHEARNQSHPPHTPIGMTLVTRLPLPASSATNQGTTPRNAQQQTVERLPL